MTSALAQRRCFDRLSGQATANLSPLLANAASPERALANLERLAASDVSLLNRLAEDPHLAELLVTVFSASQFLSDILLRRAQDFAQLVSANGLARLKEPSCFLEEARAAAASAPAQTAAALDPLRRYQHLELLRIGAADLAGLIDLASVTGQLSHLAAAVIQTCLEHSSGPAHRTSAGFTVLGLGKLGGCELNYSSDVDLLFIAQEDADTVRRVGERLIRALAEPTGEGFLYRVDMRLRPWGRVGPLVSTAAGYLAYLQRHARPWERQALLRARVVAGDEAAGVAFLGLVQDQIFEVTTDQARRAVHAMKQLTEAHLRLAGRDWGEVKLGAGSIRDAEFVVQYLQLAHGAAHPEVRTGNTVDALARLADAGLLPREDYLALSDGYRFLRTVEHYLQMLDNRQTHTLPSDSAGLRYLAQRLGFSGEAAGSLFVARYEQHSAAIRAVYLRHLDPPPADHAASQRGALTMQGNAPNTADSPPDSEIHRHLARLTPSYAATFSPAEIARHVEMAGQLSDRNPVEVRAEPGAGDTWRVTVVAYDYLGELSVICGLLFAHGMSIIDGHVHTYEPGPEAGREEETRAATRAQATNADARRKIVDVFTVRATHRDPADMGALWRSYATDLAALLRLLQANRQREAQGELAKRLALSARPAGETVPTLPPVEIEVDNEASERYTVLRITAPDTIGFLYEVSGALALSGIHIGQVAVSSAGNRVHDTLYITDRRGQKISAPERQRELRAATVLVKHFTHLLPHSPDPALALQHFHEYLGELFDRPSWPDELASLERPEVLHALARLLGVSDFLWDDFLRMQYANLFPVVRDVGALATARSKEELADELEHALAGPTAGDVAGDGAADWRDALNAFKDREMFRADMRHILGLTPTFELFAAELTDLAEVVVCAAVRRCEEETAALVGKPVAADGRPPRLSVCALGKCGGREMGFASDVELMFIFDGSGETTGARPITAAEYYERVVVEFLHAIRARREGIFEIDLALRPYGRAGSLAVALPAFRRYFSPGGPAWSYERQALVKLRAIAGDPELGALIEALRDEYVYSGAAFDLAAMRAMRERQLRHLVTPGTLNAKFSQGGLADLEYMIQGLQIRHGAADPSLRVTNTEEAITRLLQAGLLSAENAARLRGALVFLQQLINALRMVRGNNKDLTVPPQESEEFAFLARRLGYGAEPHRLGVAISEHMTWVRQLNLRLLG